MSIETGSRIGSYEIVSRIGAGGLGEVWRARDEQNDRTVAIKVLPREFSDNAQLRIRFEREAKMIAALGHPHICALFGYGDNYIVMELLEGETLASRLAQGPLTLREVTRYGVQMAAALDKAHGAGLIHRELTPVNVMLTPSGAKLLDFGLSRWEKLLNVANVDTFHKRKSREVTLATAIRYMPPEQLNGAEPDQRGDVFSLGAILYEMIAGRPAFPGEDAPEVIGAILREEPPLLNEQRPGIPPLLVQAVGKCLHKRRSRRWQTAGDLCDVLSWTAGAQSLPTV